MITAFNAEGEEVQILDHATVATYKYTFADGTVIAWKK